ncbi:hypothetical protein CAPTEDRAFT_202668 [Capitella teleta]|uniref:Uncharacterized protein n=1 Tax=Capitella teleta TaxID=283909 RepID=R7VBW1_CAPTE|nr:hypothetical protein CAPTEDRAFT_202668 [Capitella teleta]|eukprot:ELU16114.1 hypothetical protein CAPTEDRAFT_202668 [Capitella teleta]
MNETQNVQEKTKEGILEVNNGEILKKVKNPKKVNIEQQKDVKVSGNHNSLKDSLKIELQTPFDINVHVHAIEELIGIKNNELQAPITNLLVTLLSLLIHFVSAKSCIESCPSYCTENHKTYDSDTQASFDQCYETCISQCQESEETDTDLPPSTDESPDLGVWLDGVVHFTHPRAPVVPEFFEPKVIEPGFFDCDFFCSGCKHGGGCFQACSECLAIDSTTKRHTTYPPWRYHEDDEDIGFYKKKKK